MNLDKHIIIKEKGTLMYSNLSPIYKETSKYCLDENGYCGDDILFNPPLGVMWKYSEISFMEEEVMVKKIELEYDFGMSYEFFPEKEIVESPDYWKYRGIDLSSSILDIVKRYVEDQLIYSLHRNPCEMGTIHWALRGWLRDRAILPWHNQLVKL
jgi:hypothetical protein